MTPPFLRPALYIVPYITYIPTLACAAVDPHQPCFPPSPHFWARTRYSTRSVPTTARSCTMHPHLESPTIIVIARPPCLPAPDLPRTVKRPQILLARDHRNQAPKFTPPRACRLIARTNYTYTYSNVLLEPSFGASLIRVPHVPPSTTNPCHAAFVPTSDGPSHPLKAQPA